MPEEWFQAGEAFIRWVQGYRHPVLDVFFAVASLLGEEVFFLVFLPLVYWAISATLGRWLAYALISSAYLNSVLKYLFLTPRPPEVYWHHVLRPEGPGFPSGHAQVGATFWGTAAAHVRSRWARVGFAFLVAVVAFSRVYNGVHYPHDVVGGLIIGLLWLVVLLRGGPYVARGVMSLGMGAFLALSILGAGVLVILHPAAGGVWPAPPALSLVGTLWGMSLGFWVERRLVRFDAEGSLLQRLARIAVGLLVVAAVYEGLRYVTPPTWAGPARFGRYALVGFVVAAGMPWLFTRLGLAPSRGRDE